MRNIEDLEANALKFWPQELAEQEQNSSIIPRLIDSQDRFISILNSADANPFSWKEVLSHSSLSDNLFLKHLIVLSDVGGEKLMRFKKELPTIFPDNTLNFRWKNNDYSYTFQTLSQRGNWNNTNLYVDGQSLLNEEDLTPMMEDVCNLLLFGGSEISADIPNVIEERCIIGSLIGEVDELERFVKQRYIWVSRITGGATANAMGHLVQGYVVDYLKESLPTWRFNQDQLPNVSQNERTSLSVDIVAKSPNDNFCGIEVSFQVTTNSVIERKAGQAQARQNLLHEQNHYIAYVIDGAGNFARASALRTICQYSDCTVSLQDEELDSLVEFLESIDNQ